MKNVEDLFYKAITQMEAAIRLHFTYNTSYLIFDFYLFSFKRGMWRYLQCKT
jgi:hypothetical protein